MAAAAVRLRLVRRTAARDDREARSAPDHPWTSHRRIVQLVGAASDRRTYCASESVENNGMAEPQTGPLDSAYAKLRRGESRHVEMGRTLKEFVRSSDGGAPYGIHFES